MTEHTEGQPGQDTTREYPLQGFKEVQVSSAIEFDITRAADFSVKATGDEKLIDRLKIKVEDERLIVGLESGFSQFSLGRSEDTAKVTVTMPELRALAASGASSGTVRGFKSADDFELQLSGASHTKLDMETGKTAVAISGAGALKGQLKAQATRLKLSGASRCRLSGAGGDLVLHASGASQADLSEFKTANADVGLSGASRAGVNVDGRLDAGLSGASDLEYTGNVTPGKTGTTGASRLHANKQ